MNNNFKESLFHESTILKNKFITSNQLSCKQRYKEKGALQQQCQDLKKSIQQKFKEYGKTIESYESKVKEQFQWFEKSLSNEQNDEKANDQKSHINLISLRNLGNYLQNEKLYLKELMAEQTANLQSDRLHKILARKRFQELLVSLNQKQIEEEIKYIQSNILIAKGVYFDISPPSQQQEIELKRAIGRQLQELQRVVNLSIMCKTPQTSSQKSKTLHLQKQNQRLSQVSKILQKQRETIEEFNKVILEIAKHSERVPMPPKIVCSVNPLISQIQSIDPRQIQQLLEINSSHKLQQNLFDMNRFEEKVQDLRKKIHKIETWVNHS